MGDAKWMKDSLKMSLEEMKKAAKALGVEVHFDWEAARSVEGYYRIHGSTEYCIERAIAWTPYADAIWMETGKPIYSQAKQFATEVQRCLTRCCRTTSVRPSIGM